MVIPLFEEPVLRLEFLSGDRLASCEDLWVHVH
jgi:hypothetical protein